MKYNQLDLKKDKRPTRLGRGISAGGGKTAGRGTKGQGSRKSGGVRPGFEGGQMPLYMRIPKLRGFKSHRTKADTIYLGQLQTIKTSAIDNQSLYEAKLVSSPYTFVKVLSGGELTAKKIVKLQSASQNAQTAIQKAGGTFTQVNRLQRASSKTSA